MSDIPTVYDDDDDAHVDWEQTDRDGNNLDWPNPTVAIGPGAYDIAATWLGDPAPTRTIRVPLAGIPGGGVRAVYLKVPGGSDILLGHVHIQTRS